MKKRRATAGWAAALLMKGPDPCCGARDHQIALGPRLPSTAGSAWGRITGRITVTGALPTRALGPPLPPTPQAKKAQPRSQQRARAIQIVRARPDVVLVPPSSLVHNPRPYPHPNPKHFQLLQSSSHLPPFFSHPTHFQKCLPKLHRRPPAARPPLERPPLRRRRLARRRPLPLARRRSAPSPGRRPTAATSTRVSHNPHCSAIWPLHLAFAPAHCFAAVPSQLHPDTRLKPSRIFPSPSSCLIIIADAFLCLVLKQVHPDTGISNRAMSILNSFVNGMSRHTRPESSICITN